MQHYVNTRKMFLDVEEVVNSDVKLVLGDQGLQTGLSNISRGLSTLFREITGSLTFLMMIEINF